MYIVFYMSSFRYPYSSNVVNHYTCLDYYCLPDRKCSAEKERIETDPKKELFCRFCVHF